MAFQLDTAEDISWGGDQELHHFFTNDTNGINLKFYKLLLAELWSSTPGLSLI